MTFQIAETVKLHHTRKTKLLKLALAFEADYPALSMTAFYNDDESQIVKVVVSHTGIESGEEQSIGDFTVDEIPAIGDILEWADECGVDPEEGYEEDEPSGSVVPESYRAAYKANEATIGQSCGDWLAVWLEGETASLNGFDVDAFQAILDASEVDNNGKWASLPQSGQRGWVGRWRMNGRQQLEKVIARTGFLWDANGKRVEVPEAFLAEMQGKHVAYLNKLAKERAKAAKAEAA